MLARFIYEERNLYQVAPRRVAANITGSTMIKSLLLMPSMPPMDEVSSSCRCHADDCNVTQFFWVGICAISGYNWYVCHLWVQLPGY